MKAAVSQEREDETEHGVEEQYRFATLAPVRVPFGTLDLCGIGVIMLVMVVVATAEVLGLIDEVKLVVRLFS